MNFVVLLGTVLSLTLYRIVIMLHIRLKGKCCQFHWLSSLAPVGKLRLDFVVLLGTVLSLTLKGQCHEKSFKTETVGV